MKKLMTIMLALTMVTSALLLPGCNKTDNSPLKFGMGVYASYGTPTDADGETDGTASVSATAAALLLDKAGKIVKCAIDTTENTVSYTSFGTALYSGDFKTKRELGDSYGMVAYGGAEMEWYQQVDEFCKLVEGKTLDEVAELLSDGYKGTDEVISAGCTIAIADFVRAIDKAAKAAKDTAASKEDTLSIGFVSTQDSAVNADSEANGSIDISVTICAAAKDAEGKVTDSITDALTASIAFTETGKAVSNDGEILSKRELGDSYGMASFGTDLNGDGEVKEWYLQADAFDAACKGKNSDEISALAVDGYGVESIQSAGCTIAVTDIAKAAAKAAK